MRQPEPFEPTEATCDAVQDFLEAVTDMQPKPVAQDDAAARVMSAIVAYARATRRDAKKAKGGR